MDGENTARLRQQLGASLGGEYDIERELGGGGMSRVFVARDARLGRLVVVKVLAPELAAGLSARRFEREVRLAARLQHPHVVPLLAAGEVDGLPYYTMPYVEGEALRARLAREGALPVTDAVRLVRELADALAYAHAQGVVHRDLKPENVLLSGGHAMVADFGVAKALASATQDAPGDGQAHDSGTALGMAIGTPAYMAPEQVAADPAVDARSDLYALGCVAYELLTGAPPFAGRPARALLAAHLTETPAPLEARRSDVPPQLAALVLRLLAKDPGQRPQTATEVRRELDAMPIVGVDRTPESHAAPVTPSVAGSVPVAGPDAPRRGARVRGVWLAAGAALAVALAVGGMAWYRRSAASPPAERRVVAATDSAAARRVLVVAFENATGDPALASLGRMAAEWVAQGLAESGQVEVLAGSGRPVDAGEAGLRAAAAETGAGTVVSGAYYLEGDSVRLQARVTDAARWALLRPVAPVRAPRAAPQLLLDPLRRGITVVLDVSRNLSFPKPADGGASAPDYDAYRQFVAGSDLFDRGDFAGALAHWQRAAALDSTFVSPLLISAQALLLGGDPAGADPFVRRIERRRETLAPYERGILDRLRAQLTGDHMATLAGARAIRRAAPGWPLGYFLQTLDAPKVNRPREALEAAGKLMSDGQFRRIAGTIGARDFWTAVVDAHHLLGDYAGEVTASRGARTALPDDPEPMAYELRALAALGRPAEVEPRIDSLEALPAKAGRLVVLLSGLANELDVHGLPDAARRLRSRAVAEPIPTGPARETRAARAARAHALLLLGRDAEADSLFARLVAEEPTEPAFLVGPGLLAARRGERAAAERVDTRLRALERPYDWGKTPYARAQLAAALGDRDGALALLREALAGGVAYGPALHADPALAPLRADPRFQALLRPQG